MWTGLLPAENPPYISQQGFHHVPVQKLSVSPTAFAFPLRCSAPIFGDARGFVGTSSVGEWESSLMFGFMWG